MIRVEKISSFLPPFCLVHYIKEIVLTPPFLITIYNSKRIVIVKNKKTLFYQKVFHINLMKKVRFDISHY
ncbi:MAG: hypothetical protein DRG20_05080 [Deltaproteobacteria bacterium]|nr:MAG: hypothetical protein DRG20_05080 [Deltaproteobacteria bacterium]